jgi:hypothetical protein
MTFFESQEVTSKLPPDFMASQLKTQTATPAFSITCFRIESAVMGMPSKF